MKFGLRCNKINATDMSDKNLITITDDYIIMTTILRVHREVLEI